MLSAQIEAFAIVKVGPAPVIHGLLEQHVANFHVLALMVFSALA